MVSTRRDVDRILCPVDFSEFSFPALEHAVRLGRWFDARVELLHVVPLPPFPLAGGGVPNALEVIRDQREHATLEIAELLAPFGAETVPIETKLLEGDPWRVILDEATTLPADLLVMGTHGRSGFEQLLLGSVTEKVLRRASCPVLTVSQVGPHPRSGFLFRRILCATDLTGTSEQTLEAAISLAGENDARITLLHVIASLPGEAAARASLAIPEMAPLRLSLEGEARTQLREVVTDRAPHFCHLGERVETGTPWSEIVRVASEMDAELIVMGAHAGGAVTRMLFGSTASQVVRRAGCPVLVVRETPKRRSSAEAARSAGRLSIA
jgi:nucleotide-binding universal stress UspA family protein